ncbi:MAG: DUF3307 domain-containing protein [bacterium]|jgi:hypothetical protein|nr:DUF3307 domain-containing protein [candidate division KSB1 bacterium]MDH7559642.1 DUF3307 domain-containing protein [bacterium]
MHCIWLLLLAHVVGDFVLQTDRVFSYKLTRRWGVLLHVGICAVAMVAVLLPFLGHWRPWALIILLTAWHLLLDWFKGELRRRRGLETLWMFLGDQTLHIVGIVAAVVALCGTRFSPTPLPALKALLIHTDVAIVATALLTASFASAPLIYYLQELARPGKQEERAPFPAYWARLPGYVERTVASAGAYCGGLGLIALLAIVVRWFLRSGERNVPATIEAVVGMVVCLVSGVWARVLTSA